MPDSFGPGASPHEPRRPVNLRKADQRSAPPQVSLRKESASPQTETATQVMPTAGIPTMSPPAPTPFRPFPSVPPSGPPPATWPSQSTTPGSSLPRILGIAAAIVAVVLGAVFLVKNVASNDSRGDSTAGGSHPERARDARPCSAPPDVTVRSAKLTSEGLAVATTLSAKCPDGDVVADPSFGLALSEGSTDVAAGAFNTEREPIVIPPGATTDCEFIFPNGTYWRTPELLSINNLSGVAVKSSNASQRSGLTSSATTLTADASMQPLHGNVDSVALDALRDIANADRPDVSQNLADRWIPQISSKRPGLVAEGITWSPPDILREHLGLRQRYDNVKLVWSGDWTTFRSPDWWVTVVGRPSSTSDSALAWCVSAGLDADHCYAKIVSASRGTEGTTVLQPH